MDTSTKQEQTLTKTSSRNTDSVLFDQKSRMVMALVTISAVERAVNEYCDCQRPEPRAVWVRKTISHIREAAEWNQRQALRILDGEDLARVQMAETYVGMAVNESGYASDILFLLREAMFTKRARE